MIRQGRGEAALVTERYRKEEKREERCQRGGDEGVGRREGQNTNAKEDRKEGEGREKCLQRRRSSSACIQMCCRSYKNL